MDDKKIIEINRFDMLKKLQPILEELDANPDNVNEFLAAIYGVLFGIYSNLYRLTNSDNKKIIEHIRQNMEVIIEKIENEN